MSSAPARTNSPSIASTPTGPATAFRYHRTFPVWLAAVPHFSGAPNDYAALHTVECFVRECYPDAKRVDEHRVAALFIVDVMRRFGLSTGSVDMAAYMELDLRGWARKRLARMVGRLAEWLHAQGDVSAAELDHVKRDVKLQCEAPMSVAMGSFAGGVRDVVLRPANPEGEDRPFAPPADPTREGFLATLRDLDERGMARAALEYGTALFCHYTDSDTCPWGYFDARTFFEAAVEMRPPEPDPLDPEDDGFELERGALFWLSAYVTWLAEAEGPAPLARLDTDVAARISADCLRVLAGVQPAGSTRH